MYRKYGLLLILGYLIVTLSFCGLKIAEGSRYAATPAFQARLQEERQSRETAAGKVAAEKTITDGKMKAAAEKTAVMEEAAAADEEIAAMAEKPAAAQEAVAGEKTAVTGQAASAREATATEKTAGEEKAIAAEKTAAEETAAAAVEEEETEKEETAAAEDDFQILCRIVEAEAGGEDINGRMLVANVVLNRVRSTAFPGTVAGVVFQKNNGTFQFSPVRDGRYQRVTISEETKEAVQRALLGEDNSEGALYFVSRSAASPEKMQWFDNHLTKLFQYGGHEFFS